MEMKNIFVDFLANFLREEMVKKLFKFFFLSEFIISLKKKIMKQTKIYNFLIFRIRTNFLFKISLTILSQF